MTKVTLTNLANLENENSAVTVINNNSATVQAAFDNTLSRDGTSPNQMGADFDMNSHHILNLPQPATAAEPLRLEDLNAFVGGGTVTNIPPGGNTGDTLVKNSDSNYDVKWASDSASIVAGTNIVVTGTSPVTIATTTTPVFTTINGLTLTASTGTVTVANGKIFVINNSLTFTGTDGTTITFQGTDTYVGRATTDTLTNKTFDTAGSGNVLKVNGTSISAVTGTGAVALSVSPALTGTPTAPTAAFGTNTTQLATTAFVQANLPVVTNALLNLRSAKTTAYTVVSGDTGSVLALGGSAFYTLTFNAASTYTANFQVFVLNEDTTRGKRITIPGITSFILWPLQSCLVFNQNNVWHVNPSFQRWKVPNNTTIFVDCNAGSDTNDGLVAGAGGALQTLQQALRVNVKDFYDLSGFTSFPTANLTVQLAANAVNGVPTSNAYSLGHVAYSPVGGEGRAAIVINGVSGASNTVVVSDSGGTNIAAFGGGLNLQLSNFQIGITGNAGPVANSCISASDNASVWLQGGMILGKCSAQQLYAEYNSKIVALGPFSVDGRASNMVQTNSGGIIDLSGQTITFITHSQAATSISNASPAVVTMANTFSANDPVTFTTTGTLPTGLTVGTVYYVGATGLSSSAFSVSATSGGTLINTTGAGSGTHTVNWAPSYDQQTVTAQASSKVLLVGCTYTNGAKVVAMRYFATGLSWVDTNTGTPNTVIPGNVNGASGTSAVVN